MGARERFIRDALEQEGKRLLRNQGNAIILAYNQHSGRLMNDRKISVSGGDHPVLTFEHPIYERFLDLKKKQNKDRRIHNRFIFGTYTAIARRLMYGYTEEVAAAFLKLEESSR